VALALAQEASVVVCDRGYLRHQKAWREELAHAAPCELVQAETDVVVPVALASDKPEVAARTLRPRIHRHLAEHLRPPAEAAVRRDSLALRLESVDLRDLDGVLAGLAIDRSVRRVSHYRGGSSAARRLLESFARERLPEYGTARSDPGRPLGSDMSPYLHFGQISPIEIALAARAGRGDTASKAAFLEELIVRRELSINFVHYQPGYDGYGALPAWARATLAAHRADRRDPAYTRAELEGGATHDPYWNAAMREMTETGKMHNYMRMYWGKKILEWSATPEDAHASALYLNNRYLLDGRDANSYAGVGWIFGLHDRPFVERPVFGTVRYMNAAGLERKFDIDAYVCRVAESARRGSS